MRPIFCNTQATDAYADGNWSACTALLRIALFFYSFRAQGPTTQLALCLEFALLSLPCVLASAVCCVRLKRWSSHPGLTHAYCNMDWGAAGDRFLAATRERSQLPPNLEGALASPDSMLAELRSRISCGCLQPRKYTSEPEPASIP